MAPHQSDTRRGGMFALRAALAAALLAGGLSACAPQDTGGVYSTAAIGRTASVSYGTIVGTRPVTVRGGGSGLGTAAGAVAGGVAGSFIGATRARTCSAASAARCSAASRATRSAAAPAPGRPWSSPSARTPAATSRWYRRTRKGSRPATAWSSPAGTAPGSAARPAARPPRPPTRRRGTRRPTGSALRTAGLRPGGLRPAGLWPVALRPARLRRPGGLLLALSGRRLPVGPQRGPDWARRGAFGSQSGRPPVCRPPPCLQARSLSRKPSPSTRPRRAGRRWPAPTCGRLRLLAARLGAPRGSTSGTATAAP